MQAIKTARSNTELINNQNTTLLNRESSKNKTSENKDSTSFTDLLKEGIDDVNNIQKKSEKMATEMAVGKNGNLHETMLATTYADLSFNFMVQVRNKALEAYQEVMRMPV